MPARLRQKVGKTELIASTGARDRALAEIVAGEWLTTWRRRFRALEVPEAMIDVLKVTTGSPHLFGVGTLPLREAAAASGLDVDHLLRTAANGRLKLYMRFGGVAGHLIGVEALTPYRINGRKEIIVPTAAQMPEEAIEIAFAGIVRVLHADHTAKQLVAGAAPELVLFGNVDQPETFFAPAKPVQLPVDAIEIGLDDGARLWRPPSLDPMKLISAAMSAGRRYAREYLRIIRSIGGAE